MKKLLAIAGGLIGIVALLTAALFAVAGAHSRSPNISVTCTPTGFYRDSINLTAAQINPSGTFHTKLNATGCNIGIYYGPGSVGAVDSGTEIFGANYYGVVNDGGHVDIKHARIHDIGETPLNGDQHGVGIYFSYGSRSTGTIYANIISNYQKGGIVVNASLGGATISNNQVFGQGPVNYIAQNGIQVGYGATATVLNNTVTGNSYTGSGGASSGGIIIVGGDCYGAPFSKNDKISDNLVTGNDVGIWVSDLGPTCGPATVHTNIVVNANTAQNDGINNTSGAGASGYQAGIVDQGDFDKITNNLICGAGYTYNATPPPYLFAIDATATNNATVSGNGACADGPSPSASVRQHAAGEAGAVSKPSIVK